MARMTQDPTTGDWQGTHNGLHVRIDHDTATTERRALLEAAQAAGRAAGLDPLEAFVRSWPDALAPAETTEHWLERYGG